MGLLLLFQAFLKVTFHTLVCFLPLLGAYILSVWCENISQTKLTERGRAQYTSTISL